MSACRTTLRAVSEHYGLALKIHHRFSKPDGAEWSRDPSYNGKIPPEADVYATHIVTLTFTGFSNGKLVSLEHLASSQVARHLVDYLQMATNHYNSGELGLEAVGEFSPDGKGLRLPIAPQYASRNPRTSKPHIKLCGIDLTFCWNTAEHDDPFAEHCPLPYMSLLNQVIRRFMVSQIVRRYPLVFGSWCKQLAAEEVFVKSIERSIRSITKRSRKEGFRQHVHSLIKVASQGLHQYLLAVGNTIRKSLTRNARREYNGAAGVMHIHLPKGAKDEAFVYAMEKVYKLGQKRKTFKGVSRVAGDRGKDEHTLHEEASQMDLAMTILDDVFAAPSLTSDDHDFELDMTPDDALSSHQVLDLRDAADLLDIPLNSKCPLKPLPTVVEFRNGNEHQILHDSDEHDLSPPPHLDRTIEDSPELRAVGPATSDYYYEWDTPPDFTGDAETRMARTWTKSYDQDARIHSLLKPHERPRDRDRIHWNATPALDSGGSAEFGPSLCSDLAGILDFDDPQGAVLAHPNFGRQTHSIPIEGEFFLGSDDEDFDFEAADPAKPSESCEDVLLMFPPADLSHTGTFQCTKSTLGIDTGSTDWSSDGDAEPMPGLTCQWRDAQGSRPQPTSPDQRVIWAYDEHPLPRDLEHELESEWDEGLVSNQAELGYVEDLAMGFDE